MELKITKQLAELELNLDSFREVLSQTWDLHDSIQKSVVIKYNKIGTKLLGVLKETIDWGHVIGHPDTRLKHKMAIKIVSVNYTNMMTYKPWFRTTDGKEYQLITDDKNGTTTLAITDVIGQTNTLIKRWIAENALEDTQWKIKK